MHGFEFLVALETVVHSYAIEKEAHNNESYQELGARTGLRCLRGSLGETETADLDHVPYHREQLERIHQTEDHVNEHIAET